MTPELPSRNYEILEIDAAGYEILENQLGSAALMTAGLVCSLMVTGCSGMRSDRASSPRPSDTVYTVAHATVADAARDFFGIRPRPVQPIEFPHKTHIEKGATCTDCHEA